MSEEIKTINRSDIFEESRFSTTCPYCNELTDLDDYDSHYSEQGYCEYCNKEFEIVNL